MTTNYRPIEDTITLVEAATKVLGTNRLDGAVNVAKVGSKLAQHAEGVGGSLFDVTAQTTILSRAYIDEALLDEPILANYMRNCHELYAAQVIAAFHLSRLVESGKTVQEFMAPLQTGYGRTPRSRVMSALGGLHNVSQKMAAQESFLENIATEDFHGPLPGIPRSEEKPELKRWNKFQKASRKAQDRAEAEAKTAREEEERARGQRESALAIRSVKTGDNQIGPMGELYEIKLANPNSPGATIAVPVFIQMQPTIVPTELMPRFIDINVKADLWMR